jgi:tryptophanyl-tRNA synthetase
MREMIEPQVKPYLKLLDKFGIEYRVVEHPELKTVTEVLDFCNLTYEDGASTLIFKADSRFAALIRRDDCQVDLGKVSKILKAEKVRMATREEFSELTGLKPGAARPVNPGLETLIDKKVFEKDMVQAGSGSLKCSIRYKVADLRKIPGSRTVDITQPVSKDRKRILTGDTPTGRLHIGHYVGALEERVRLQGKYETYVILANIHAYANYYRESERINRDVYEVFLDNLAVGIDPKVSTIFLESGIPEIYELYGIFLTMVKHSRVLRNPSVKEEIKYKKLDPSVGFVVYPILQAADILGFNANLVPVGEDQLPMIEQTREIARAFNEACGETFVIPEAKVGRVPRLVGTDGKLKMSKSGFNAILLSDDEKTLRQKVMACYTDPKRIHPTDPGRVEGNPVFEYHTAFNPDKDEVEDLKTRYRAGRVGDVEVKERLFTVLNTFLAPIREKRKYYEERPELTREILVESTKRARKVVVGVAEVVREKMAINDLID